MTKRGAYVTDDCFRPIGELVAELLAGIATVRPVGEVIDLATERAKRQRVEMGNDAYGARHADLDAAKSLAKISHFSARSSLLANQ